MPDSFDEQGYRRKLIDGGLSEADATALARRRCATSPATRRPAPPAGVPRWFLFELPDGPAAPEPSRRRPARPWRARADGGRVGRAGADYGPSPEREPWSTYAWPRKSAA
jgi:hypothetical protein